jgi:hypothetical protein
VSWRSGALEDLRLVLERSQPSKALLARLATALDELDDDRELTRFLLHSAEQDIGFYRGRLRDIDGSFGSVGLTAAGEVGMYRAIFRPFVAHELTRMLRQYESVLDAAERPWPERLDAIVAATASGWTLPGALWPVSTTIYPPAAWIWAYDTRWQKLQVEFAAGALASARAARVAVAIEPYRLAHDGRLPDRLDLVVPAYLPELPIDPFSGRSLVFTVTPSGYAIYSVGVNRTDDGGAEMSAPLKTPGGSTRKSGDVGLTIRKRGN